MKQEKTFDKGSLEFADGLFDYQKFVLYLENLSKDESVDDYERHKKIINSKQKLIGISMKNIRLISKYILKNFEDMFLDIAKTKEAKDAYFEETLIEGIVIANIKDLDRQIEKLKIWANKIDNWSTCDSVVTSLKILKKSSKKDNYFADFVRMCFSEYEFISRFGIVVLMSVYLDENHIDKIYQIISQISNNAYYVKMAIAWLIASGFLVDKQKTYELLKQKKLDKFIQNKAISKCRDSYQVSLEDKENLLLFKM